MLDKAEDINGIVGCCSVHVLNHGAFPISLPQSKLSSHRES